MRGSREEWLRANGFARSEQRDLRAAEPAEHGGYRGQFPRYSRLPCPVSGDIMVIGAVCHYLRDVGVAGSNPVTPTIDS